MSALHARPCDGQSGKDCPNSPPCGLDCHFNTAECTCSRDLLLDAAKAACAYDDAIRSCGNSPECMSSFCTAEGDDLDALYARWIRLSRAAVLRASGGPA